MMERVSRETLPECLEILRLSYEANAVAFGMTEHNCPYRGRTRLPLCQLEAEWQRSPLMFVDRLDGRAMAFLSLERQDDAMNIRDLAVLPEFQGLGVGSALLRLARQQALALGCSHLTLGMVDDNQALRSWYEAKGFHTVRRIRYPLVSYAVGIMECRLQSDLQEVQKP